MEFSKYQDFVTRYQIDFCSKSKFGTLRGQSIESLVEEEKFVVIWDYHFEKRVQSELIVLRENFRIREIFATNKVDAFSIEHFT